MNIELYLIYRLEKQHVRTKFGDTILANIINLYWRKIHTNQETL